MRRMLLPALATLALAAGCVHHGDVGMEATYVEPAPAPSLVYVSPGVSVVAYSDYPVFYSDNYYWRYDAGLWYRSSYYGGGWVVWNTVPYGVRTIDRPHRYVRYSPRPGTPVYYGGSRDHRHQTYHRSAPAPAVRDHRYGGQRHSGQRHSGQRTFGGRRR